MIKFKNMRKIIIGCLFLFFTPLFASADFGPKPTMDFEFENFPEGAKIIKAEQIQCKDELCLSGRPLQDAGPQSFGCSEEYGCSSLAYGYSKYNKIKITFSKGEKMESNVFSQIGMNSKYTIRFGQNGNLVVAPSLGGGSENPQESNFSVRFGGNKDMTFQFFYSLFLTLFLEIIVAMAYALIRRISRKIVWLVFLGNIISLPIFWFVDSKMYLSQPAYFIAEAIIVIFEALIIKFFLRAVSWKDCFGLSLLMNLVSLFLGGLITSLVWR